MDLPTIPKNETKSIAKDEFETLKDTLDSLVEELSAVTDIKDAFSHVINEYKDKDERFKQDFVQYFTGFSEKVDQLTAEIKNEFDYVSFLQEKIKNNELTAQVYMLEHQLQAEKNEMTLLIQKIDACIKNVKDQQEMISTMFEEKINHLTRNVDEQIEKYQDIDSRFEKSLEDYRHENSTMLTNTVNDVTNFMKKQNDDSLKGIKASAESTFKEIKKACIDFLKQCNKEAALSAKYVMNKGKLEKKDIVIIIMCAAVIINELLNMGGFR